MPFSIDSTTVAIAAVMVPVAVPLTVWVVRAGVRATVRWAANGTYARKDLFEARMNAQDAEIAQIRKNTDIIISHLLKE